MASDVTQDKSHSPEPPTPWEEGKGIKIFSYPKIIFLYPTLLAALFCGIFMLFLTEDPSSATPVPTAEEVAAASDQDATAETEDATAVAETGDEAASTDEVEGQGDAAEEPAATATAEAETETPKKGIRWGTTLAVIFLGIFGINLLVMALDFPRFTVIAAILLAIAIGLLLVVLSQAGFQISLPLVYVFQDLDIRANAGFYFCIFGILLLIYTTIFFTRWLDYWEITANEILHHHGPLSDLERYPTLHLKFEKEIPDVFEFFMAGAGRLVLYLPRERAIVLENVLFINKVENRLKRLMGQLSVKISNE